MLIRPRLGVEVPEMTVQVARRATRLVAALILGESVFACHGRRLTGGQRYPVTSPDAVPVDSASLVTRSSARSG
jgi:hypothetical protein